MLSCTCYAITGVPVIQFRTCFQKEMLILSISFYNLQFETGKKPHFSNLDYLFFLRMRFQLTTSEKRRPLKWTITLEKLRYFFLNCISSYRSSMSGSWEEIFCLFWYFPSNVSFGHSNSSEEWWTNCSMLTQLQTFSLFSCRETNLVLKFYYISVLDSLP